MWEYLTERLPNIKLKMKEASYHEAEMGGIDVE